MNEHHQGQGQARTAEVPLSPGKGPASDDALLVADRIKEIVMLCDRNHPLYERVSSFSVALYALGYFDGCDFMSFHDVLVFEAAEILRQEYTAVEAHEIAADYRLSASRERYLLVIGDPQFPAHFALLVNNREERPYFSKLPMFGAGFDSLEDLVAEFSGKEGVGAKDFHYYRKNRP